MGEGFTPTFFLQLAIAIGGIFGAYYAVKNKIDSIGQRLDDHINIAHVEVNRRLGETRESIHDIRDKQLGPLGGRVSKLEGFRDAQVGNGG